MAGVVRDIETSLYRGTGEKATDVPRKENPAMSRHKTVRPIEEVDFRLRRLLHE